MNKILLLVSMLLGSIASQAQAPKFKWANGMGGTTNEAGNAIAVDNAGNVYTSGNFTGTIRLDAFSNPITSRGFNDVFFCKHDSAGNLLWARAIGGLSDDLVRGIAIDKDENVYITGNYNQTCDFDPTASVIVNLTSAGIGDVFVAKYDQSGFLIWAKSFGSTGADLGFGIAVDTDGYIYSTGNFAGTVDFDPGAGISNINSGGSSDIYISKLDKDGNYEWAKSIGGTEPDGGVGIGVDKEGNVFTGGSFQGTVDFDPGTPVSNITSFGNGDICIVKLNSMGLFQWAKQIGGENNDYLEHLTLDKWGNVFYTANYGNGADFDPSAATFNLTGSGKIVTSKLNNNGEFVWAKKIGSVGNNERSKAVAADIFGSIYTVGEFGGTQDFNPSSSTANLTSAGPSDVFISKLDSLGNFSWAINFGGKFANYGNGIAVSRNGSVHTTGYFTDTCDFDPSDAKFNRVSAGSSDIFVNTLSQCIINKTTTLTGNTISANMSGVSYQWVSCPNYAPISGAMAQSFSPISSGNYAVIITNGAGCKDTSACVAVIASSLKELPLVSNFSMYPNPASHSVVLNNLNKGSIINIINSLGVSVYQGTAGNDTMTIDINELSSGIYFVQVIKESKTQATQKLLISK